MGSGSTALGTDRPSETASTAEEDCWWSQCQSMSSDNMNSSLAKLKKVYKPVLFLLCLATGVFAIAGAAITARDDEVSLAAPTEALPRVDTAAKLMMKLKTAQDLFICIIVWALLASMVGLAALHAHSSPSTKYEVNEKRDEEKKGVDNTGFEGNKKSADVEKGDDKWKQNYVPYDDKEKESE